jgi:hypothetical protein
LAGSAIDACPSRRFRVRVFEVKIWRANACRRLILPVPVFLNRLDAPLWVFNFGIYNFLGVGHPHRDNLFDGSTARNPSLRRELSCKSFPRPTARQPSPPGSFSKCSSNVASFRDHLGLKPCSAGLDSTTEGACDMRASASCRSSSWLLPFSWAQLSS